LVLASFAGLRGWLGTAFTAARNPQVARRLLAGTVAGPVGGMLFYVAALKYQPAGIVATITFMCPLLIIPLGTWRYGTRLGLKVLLGGAVALAGVVFLGWDPGS
jgi:drug/metabolite transporter (DMT)-like permease